MKRSEINTILRDTDAFVRSLGFHLPPFAYWTPAEWATKGEEAREIVAAGLGWDITDFGLGDFQNKGLFLFTLRNGLPENWKTHRGKLYAEKILVSQIDQLTPLHFHWDKMEDIINRGGGTLKIQLYNATSDEKIDALKDVQVSMDGVLRTLPAGSTVELSPGESITLPPYCYHKFWASGGRVLAGEVSSVNDDHIDNRFYDPVGRFPEIEEDEPPLYLLVNDYSHYYRPQA
ncbi:MAG TPA: D-lyxose/D-mannose family sugar isomerase [Anaerolineales bacterium]